MHHGFPWIRHCIYQLLDRIISECLKIFWRISSDIFLSKGLTTSVVFDCSTKICARPRKQLSDFTRMSNALRNVVSVTRMTLTGSRTCSTNRRIAGCVCRTSSTALRQRWVQTLSIWWRIIDSTAGHTMSMASHTIKYSYWSVDKSRGLFERDSNVP